jgi:hypothetical protein
MTTDRPTPHFTWSELTVRRGVPGAELAHVTRDTRAELVRVAEVLEAIRAAIGKPLRVTSAYRHGDPRQHGAGQAADVQADGVSPLALLRLVRELHAAGRLPHPLRQVIAESLHGDPSACDRPMGEGSGQWLHVAIRGSVGHKFADDTASAWLLSWQPANRDREYRSV